MVTTAALALLVVVLVVAAFGRVWMALATAVLAMLAFNYFFLDPIGTFTIADAQNWLAFLAFVAAALIGGQLSSIARRRTEDALDSRNVLAQLFDLSRDVLLTGESSNTMDALAHHVARRFGVSAVAVCLRTAEGWRLYQGGEQPMSVDDAALEFAFARAGKVLEFDARERAYGGHAETASTDGHVCTLAPVRQGTTPVGFLAVPSGTLRIGTLDAVAGLVAIAIEREQFIAERKTAELLRQKADFTSTLLASLSHDLRTPLTAIRVAVENLDNPALPAITRQQQTQLAQSELDRLTRLFKDILDMARIESASFAPEREWVTPADVIDAAMANLQPLLSDRPIAIDATDDVVVHVDPRLTSSALAHLIENAAQYAPTGTPLEIVGRVTDAMLTLSVRDHGPGIEPSEIDRIFERFYRGRREEGRTIGTGMGLAITRGLLAVESGRVWAENPPDGGAKFSIAIPAAIRAAVVES